MGKELSDIKRNKEVFETRKVVSLSVLVSCQEPEKQEEPQRVVIACLGIRDGGPNVVCLWKQGA